MKDLSIDGVLFSHTLYVEEEMVEAYAIHHLENSETLYDYYEDYSFFNFNQMLHSFKDASLILRCIHENKIVGGDINFDNILINQNGFLQYIDVFDSCHFGSFCSANFVSLALYNFMTLYRGTSSFDINENTDRISFLLAIRSLIANKSNTIRHFIELKQKETIQDVEACISLLKGSNRYKELPEVPYFDELIEESDYSTPSLFPNKTKNKKM